MSRYNGLENVAVISLRRLRDIHLLFWREHPALLCALTLLIGTSSLLFLGHLLWPLLWCAYLIYCRLFPQIFLLLGTIFYGWCHLPPSQLPTGEITALFSPASLQPNHSPFQKGLVYKGSLTFDRETVPCSVFYRGLPATRPRADQNYCLSGKIEHKGDFFFKAKQWIPVAKSWSLAELRYQTKERFKKVLSEHLPSSRVATFLSSLTTGDVEDRLLRYEFSRLGIQHILAISGFHFGILIAFCTFALGLFLPRIWKIGALFLAVNAYFLFVGSSPSVQRSWLTALFYLFGQFLGRPANGLNLLGCALGTELICNPLAAGNLGFQLSFLSCAGILLFYPTFDRFLQTFFPKRSGQESQPLTPLAKHGALLASFFRQSISLTLAVNLLLLPLLLHHFHQFPLLGLLYNLFFPFMIGVTLFLLLIALLFLPLYSPIATLFFFFTDHLTAQLLELTSNPPFALDYLIQTQEFPAWAIPPFLFILLNLYLLITKPTESTI